MSKRLTTALLALLTFAAVLAVIPLASPASAHEQTKTVKRCAYDPFAGNQCWNETVTVAHTHRVIPDNPPPDTSPKPKKCPAGTTGTPPNCLPVPPDNSNHVPPTTTAAPPTTQPPPECPPGTVGTYPDCKTPPPPECPPGTTGTYPNCVTTPPTTQPKTTTPPDCADGEHRHTLGAQRNRGGGTASACHAASASHCNSGQHEHVHGSQECHKTTGKELKNNPCEDGLVLDASWQSRRADSAGCFTMHCPSGQHEHVHGSKDCHAENTNHDPPCPGGYFWNGSECEKNPLLKIVDKVVFTVGGDVVCTFVAGQIGAKAANLVVKGGTRLYKWFAGAAVEEYAIPLPCDELWDEYVESQAPPNTVDPEDDGTGTSGTDAPPADPNEPDNTDYTYDGGAHARKMCAEQNIAYFCNLVKDNEPSDGE